MTSRTSRGAALAVALGLALHATGATAQTTLSTPEQTGWVFSADYLYWSLRTPGVQYGVTDIGGVQDRGPVGEVLTLDNEYDDGFRFSFGRRFDGGPEVLFSYTTFDSTLEETRLGPLRATFVSADNSENNDSDDSVNDITPDDRATSVTASQLFNYETYDLEIGQLLTLTDVLTLRLSGGARATNLDSRFDVTYTGGDFQTPFSAFKTTDFSGGGLVLGGDLRWQLTNSVRLDFGADLGMMLGQISTQTFIPDDEPGVPTNVTYNETRMAPMLGMNAAINYRRPIGRFVLNGAVGYEFVNWFNLEDSRVFTESHIEAQNAHLIQDLSLDGLFARFGINY